MDFSKLDSNEKLAVYGAIASIVGPVLASLGYGFGVGWFTLILAIAMLLIVFLPQISPQTNLPGSKGSLMVVVGLVAGVSAFLALISSIGILGALGANAFFVIGWLVGIAGGLIMGYAGWLAFQAEGGKFQIGSTAGSADATGTGGAAAAPPASTPSTSPSAEPAAAPPPAASSQSAATPPAAPPPSAATPPAALSPAAPTTPPADSGMGAPSDSGMSSPPSSDMGSSDEGNQV